MATNPYELRLQIWQEAKEHLVKQYFDLKDREPESKKKYPTNREIIALANQIRKFCDYKGEESGDNQYSVIKELLKEEPEVRTIRAY